MGNSNAKREQKFKRVTVYLPLIAVNLIDTSHEIKNKSDFVRDAVREKFNRMNEFYHYEKVKTFNAPKMRKIGNIYHPNRHKIMQRMCVLNKRIWERDENNLLPANITLLTEELERLEAIYNS